MDTIKSYVESVFVQLPRTPEMQQLKEDMLTNMEDKYLQLKSEGQSENEAIGTVLSEFGNIDEIIEEYNLEKDSEEVDKDSVFLSEAEVEDFMQHRTKFGLGIATGVALCILAPAVMLLFNELANLFSFNSPANMEGIDLLSIIPLFIFIAIAVGIFIIFGLKEEQYNLDKKVVILDPSTRIHLDREMQEFKPSFAKAIAAGVILCILAPISLLLAIVLLGDDNAWSVIFLLGFVSVGVFLFVFYGVLYSTYEKLLSLGDYQPEKVIASKLTDTIAGVVFPIATAVYLLLGFIYNAWGTAWIIFPITGILFAAFSSLYQSLIKTKRRK
ncbi:permease prefix domain 1-containing protein [Carnobacterium sp.]|uniref:permease prefix domain 1-containing protein n=1 Tax=Carnobacterium sp. TaxID=48221 RepID=UPI00388E5751